ncbi:DUF5652 family protein [Leifsonia sp. NPDC056824]|uniref:DUF5652 family protein n=1 Tax=Leifsonia sp. NPDC056824 TaxID=3345953 RepID=UPI0036CA7918
MRDHIGSPRMGMHGVPPAGRALVVAVVAWSLAWKGASLWRAARNGSKPWFVALLLSNTLGLLDAVYLFGVDRRHRLAQLEEDVILAVTGEPEQEGHSDET